jgi:glutathione synthase/RimK-type ligase-like ATP-grasp enzyme
LTDATFGYIMIVAPRNGKTRRLLTYCDQESLKGTDAESLFAINHVQSIQDAKEKWQELQGMQRNKICSIFTVYC